MTDRRSPRPGRPARTFDAIPAELRDRDQWLVWKREQRGAKVTKVPYRARRPDVRASATDPATWAPYSDAVRAARRPDVDGIGFVFTEGDPYVGVDFDACVRDGVVDPAAQAEVTRLDSWTELSQSGTGLHVIARAVLVDGRHSGPASAWGGKIELYDRGRFFALTGQLLAGAEQVIRERQAQIVSLRARLLPEDAPAAGSRLRLAVNPALTPVRHERRLVTVDQWDVAVALATHPGLSTLVERQGGDQSSRDFALACAAARDGLDVELIEQLVTHRRLLHGDPKGKASRPDYVPRTVARAIAAVTRRTAGWSITTSRTRTTERGSA